MICRSRAWIIHGLNVTRSVSFEVAQFCLFPEGDLEISPGQASECERRPGKERLFVACPERALESSMSSSAPSGRKQE